MKFVTIAREGFYDAIDWMLEHAIEILFAAGGLALFYHAMTKEPAKYLKAPVESCTSASTGQKREWDTTSMICVSYASNGTCSVWMPHTTHHVEHEARVTCDWLEWR